MKKLILLCLLLASCASTPPTVVQDAVVSIAITKLVNTDPARAQEVIARVRTLKTLIQGGSPEDVMRRLGKAIKWQRLSEAETVLVVTILDLVYTKIKGRPSVDTGALEGILMAIERTASRYLTPAPLK